MASCGASGLATSGLIEGEGLVRPSIADAIVVAKGGVARVAVDLPNRPTWDRIRLTAFLRELLNLHQRADARGDIHIEEGVAVARRGRLRSSPR